MNYYYKYLARLFLTSSCLLLALALAAGPCLGADAAPPTQVLRVGVRSMHHSASMLEKRFAKPSMSGSNLSLMAMLEPILGVRVRLVVSSSHVERRRLLQEGKIDVIALDSPELTPDDDFDFVPLGLHINRQLFVHKSRQDIFSTDDLCGVRIAVVAGDNYQPHLCNALEATVVETTGPLQALQMLNTGQVVAFLAPSARTAENIITLEELHNVVKVGLTIERISMCLAIRKDNQALKKSLSQAVLQLAESGQLKALHEKWYDVHYGPNPWKVVFKWGLWGIGLALAAVVLFALMSLHLKSKVNKITEDLRSSEESYRGLIQSAPDMVVVLDEQGLISHCNPVAEETLGGSAGVLVGKPLTDFAPQETREGLLAFVAATFETGSGHQEFKMQDRKGSCHEVDLAARLLPTPPGEGRRICCFARDVTQRNAIDRELVRADRLSTIGKLAAGVAHEINNPIGIVRANVDLLLAHKMHPPEALEFLESIKRNAMRAGRTAQDLLAVARPKTPQMCGVNLRQLMDMVLGMLGPQLKNIAIKLEMSGRDPLVWGDPHLLQQVMVNLLLNAKTAMNGCDDRRLLIRFCARKNQEDVRLRIEDNGRGIAKEHLNEIFEPFFTHGKKDGFGLGLFISRHIIERQGGIIFAESARGQGAQFIIEMPALMENSSRA